MFHWIKSHEPTVHSQRRSLDCEGVGQMQAQLPGFSSYQFYSLEIDGAYEASISWTR